MKKNFLQIIAFVLMLSIVSSCRKDAFEGTPSKGKGKTFLRFANAATTAPRVITFFSPFTDLKDVVVFSLKRDAYSNQSLNSTVVVNLDFDAAGLTAHNTSANASITMMPEAMYAVKGNEFERTSTGYKVTFAPGEVSKTFSITIDGSKFDLSKTYAIMLKVAGVTGDATVTANTKEATIMSVMSIKNAYDGVFSITSGHVQRWTAFPTLDAGTLSGDMSQNPDVTLSSIDANTVEITNMKWSVSANGGVVSGLAGVDNLRLTVDPATNSVRVFALGNTTLANIAGEANSWNPTTKTFTLNFDWNQTSNKRAITNFVIKYSKSR